MTFFSTPRPKNTKGGLLYEHSTATFTPPEDTLEGVAEPDPNLQ